MILHTDSERFSTLITFTAEHFRISPAFIEKDYWITRSLQRMSQNSNAEKVVFKGGTSLSKAYRLTNRFSEDIDIAVIDVASFTSNQLKMLIKRLAKDMANELEEKVVEGVTSKGSRFYKAIYVYPNLTGLNATITAGQLLIEINTYTNPYPYVKQEISCFIADYLETIHRRDLIVTYQLSPFSINVLDKCRTLVEKLVSLIRFSFSENPTIALATKIRHFYDLYYLVNEVECLAYIQSAHFRTDLEEVILHDQQEFDEPKDWQAKTVGDSPLVKNFPALWESLRTTYQKELVTLAFSEIPNEKLVAESFRSIIEKVVK